MKMRLQATAPLFYFLFLSSIYAHDSDTQSIAFLKDLVDVTSNSSDILDSLRKSTFALWSPVVASPLNKSFVLPYRAQINDPKNGVFNPIHEKIQPFRDAFMEVNFLRNLSREASATTPQFFDLFSKFHKEEIKLRESPLRSDHPLQVNSEVIKYMQEHVFVHPRHMKTNEKEEMGIYIFKKMGSLGLIIYLQPFHDGVPVFVNGGVENMGSGGNIIGILPGKLWMTPADKPIVIGAHWDTVSGTSGYDDNASGISALLEIATVLTSATCYQNKYSVIFVLFDSEENGCYGSLEFIRSYLKPFYLDAGMNLTGVFVLDSISNYDDQVDSQDIPYKWENIVPETVKDILNNERRGDFISLITRKNASREEDALSETFVRHLRLLDPSFPRVTPIKLNISSQAGSFPDIMTLMDHSTFLMSDHSRFWFYKENGTDLSLPGAIITDTSGYRGYMRECYHRKCDSFTNRNIPHRSIDFMSQITQALVLSVLELTSSESPSKCDPESIYAEVPKSNDEEIASPVVVHRPMSPLDNLLFHGKGPFYVKNYQPNYGNVYNIGSLTIKLQGETLSSSLSEDAPLTKIKGISGALSQVKNLIGKRNSPIMLFLNDPQESKKDKV